MKNFISGLSRKDFFSWASFAYSPTLSSFAVSNTISKNKLKTTNKTIK